MTARRSATTVLAAVLVGVFLLELALGAEGNETALHLMLNLAALLWLGRVVERRVGSAAMLAVFGGAAAMSGATGMLLGPFLPTTGIAIGASGAVFGLLGAALVLVFRSDAGRDRRLGMTLTTCLIVGIATSLLPGVSLAGHLGGLMGGALVVPIIFRARLTPRPAA